MSGQASLLDRRWRTRLVLAAGTIGGFLTILFYIFLRPSPNTTFGVFYAAAESAMAGDVVYHTEHGLFVYTPVVLLFFYPFTWLFELSTAVVAFRAFNVLFVLGYAVYVTRFIAGVAEIDRIDWIVIGGFISMSIYPVTVIATANMGIVFGSLLGIGFIMLERGKDRGGAMWAIASLIKGFPALWGVYLLRVKRWKAVGWAIVTGVTATLFGLLLYGVDAYLRFFTSAASSRVRIDRFTGGMSPDNEMVTPVRPLSQVFPNVDPHVWPPIILVSVLFSTIAVYYLIPKETLVDRSTLLLSTVIGLTLILPTSQDLDMYLLYVPVLVLLFQERNRSIHWIYLLGTVVLSYNIGREELRSVSGIAGQTFSDVVMWFGEPILSFASMPLYGMLLLYAGCLLKAYQRGRETGRIGRVGS